MTKLQCYIDPSDFLEAAELMPVWRNMSNRLEFARDLQVSLVRSKAWHELKEGGADVFTAEDTRLTARFTEMKGGLTNACFRLQTRKGNFFLRVPGKGSEDHLSRQEEALNVEDVHRMGLNIEIYFINPKTGFYAGEFIEDATPLSSLHLSQKQTLRDVAGILKTLHTGPIKFQNDIPIFARLNKLLCLVNDYDHSLLHDGKLLSERIKLLEEICSRDNSPLVACHNDPTYLNFLYHKDKLRLLDWEYSGNSKAMFDLANFAHTSKLSKDAEQSLLQAYYGKSPTKQTWKIFSAYKQTTALWYYLWAEVQLANHSNLVPRNELVDLAHQNWEYVMQRHTMLPKLS